MKKNIRLYVAALLIVLTNSAIVAQIKVEPSFWWIGMKNPNLQLLVHAKNISDADVQINYKGVELNGKTLGVIGAGRIGKRVASYAKALGMDIVMYDPFVNNDEIAKHGTPNTIDSLLLSPSYNYILPTPA